jgi:hypothetical protein
MNKSKVLCRNEEYMGFWRKYFKEIWIEPAKKPYHWLCVVILMTIGYFIGWIF